MPGDEVLEHPERREFLTKAVVTVGVAGAAVACWPFISSMNPAVDVLEKAAAEVDLSGIALGQVQTVSWGGKPVFVMHRTAAQIGAMESSEGGFDPQPDEERVKRPEWLVVVGVCTHMGCIPIKKDFGWLCPCHGSMYDNSGRVVRGPAPKNLAVPPYRFVSTDKIVIGEA
jgi:ubiquinol-cytochrome c reductase iron-sulfur subunit